MPLIAYSCECGHSEKKLFRQIKDISTNIPCTKCKGQMKKMLSAPSSSSKIVIDNGFQAKSVEILPNIVEINEERSRKNYSNDE